MIIPVSLSGSGSMSSGLMRFCIIGLTAGLMSKGPNNERRERVGPCGRRETMTDAKTHKPTRAVASTFALHQDMVEESTIVHKAGGIKEGWRGGGEEP